MKKWIAWFCLFAISCKDPDAKQSSLEPEPELQMQTLQSPSRFKAGEPALFTDPAGAVFLSWIEETDSLTHRLVYSQLKDSNWTEPRTIASGQNWFVNWADFPRLASDGRGNMMATWLQKNGRGTYAYDVMMTFSSDGNAWKQPAKLNEDGKEAEHGFVSIITHPDSGFIVAWLDGRNTMPMPAGSHDHEGHEGGAMSLRAAILDKDGKKRNEKEIDQRTCDCCQTALALGSGGALLLYRDRSEQEVRDIQIARMDQQNWLEPEPLSKDGWVVNGCPVNGPRVAANGTKAVVAWYTEAQDQPAVYAAFSEDGGASFGQRIRIHDSIPLGRVGLVLAGHDMAYISWMEGSRILVRPVSPDGTTGPVYQVAENSSARSAGFPQVTEAGNQLIIAWTDAAEKRIQTRMLGPGISPRKTGSVK